MPRQTLTDQTFDTEGNVLEESTRTESDKAYVNRVIRESRAPTQVNKFELALSQWSDTDENGDYLWFPSITGGGERDLLFEMLLHLRANATDRAATRDALISDIAAEFETRGL